MKNKWIDTKLLLFGLVLLCAFFSGFLFGGASTTESFNEALTSNQLALCQPEVVDACYTDISAYNALDNHIANVSWPVGFDFE